MNELIKINDDFEIPTVNARELHEFIGNKRQFSDWIKQRITQYGFAENSDYIITQISEKSPGRPSTEYHLTLETAKEISMVEKNHKGKLARRYFIEAEKKLKKHLNNIHNIPRNYAEALRLAADQAEKLEKYRPLVEFAEAVSRSENSILVREYVKLLDPPVGQNAFYNWLREEGYIFKNSTEPYQEFLDRGYFERKEKIYHNKAGDEIIGFTTMITGKGQIYFERKWKEHNRSEAGE